VRKSSGGLQRSLSLRTPNREDAAQTARDWFVYLSVNGWAAFDAKYRPASLATSSPRPLDVGVVKSSNVTVGDFLIAVRNESDLAHRTIDGYARCLRLIVSEIRALTRTRTRFDYRKGGRKAWAAAIDATLLEQVTPDRIREWKRAYIDRAGHDVLLRRRYTISCNSYLRQKQQGKFEPTQLSVLDLDRANQ